MNLVDDKLYIYGGKVNSFSSSNLMYIYNFKNKCFNLVNPESN